MLPSTSDPGSFQTPIPPLVAMGGAPLYVTGEDALAVTVFNAAAGVTVTVTGRILQFGQTRPTPFAQTILPATDRSASVNRFTLGDGWLLNAQAIVSAGTPLVGQTFVRLSLVRGVNSNAPELFTLASDYVTAKMPLSYPGSSVAHSVDSAGAIRSITGATPAAGAEISETVPTGARWEVLAFMFQLVTSVAAANRLPSLALDDGANTYAPLTAKFAQAASLTFFYHWSQGMPQIQDATRVTNLNPLPTNLRMGSGHRIKSATSALQAADQYSGVQYLVREWIEGA